MVLIVYCVLQRVCVFSLFVYGDLFEEKYVIFAPLCRVRSLAFLVIQEYVESKIHWVITSRSLMSGAQSNNPYQRIRGILQPWSRILL